MPPGPFDGKRDLAPWRPRCLFENAPFPFESGALGPCLDCATIADQSAPP
jgi:hypothetical protein